MFWDFLAVLALLILIAVGLGKVGVVDTQQLCHLLATGFEALGHLGGTR